MSIKKIIIISLTSLVLLAPNVSADTENECFEKLSRNVFKFNKGFDKAILRPIAKGYNSLPEPIKKGTWSFANDSLSIVENDREEPSGLLKSDTKGIRSINQYHLVMEGLGTMNFETGYSKSYNYFIHFVKNEN